MSRSAVCRPGGSAASTSAGLEDARVASADLSADTSTGRGPASRAATTLRGSSAAASPYDEVVGNSRSSSSWVPSERGAHGNRRPAEAASPEQWSLARGAELPLQRRGVDAGQHEDSVGLTGLVSVDTSGGGSRASQAGRLSQPEGGESPSIPKSVIMRRPCAHRDDGKQRPHIGLAPHSGWSPMGDSASSSPSGRRRSRLGTNTDGSTAETTLLPLSERSKAVSDPPRSAPAALGSGLSIMQAVSTESTIDWARLLCRPPAAPPDPDDPASSCASAVAVYGPGASRILRPGIHTKVLARHKLRQGLRDQGRRRSPRSGSGRQPPGDSSPTAAGSAGEAAPQTARGRLESGEASFSSASPWRRVSIHDGEPAGGETPTAHKSLTSSGSRSLKSMVPSLQVGAARSRRSTAEGSPPNSPLSSAAARLSPNRDSESSLSWTHGRFGPSAEQIENMVAAKMRGDTLATREGRRRTGANSVCPFPHESMDDSSCVDLRCGHRFALSRLQAAKRAAEVCYAAGFGQKDALICPLCGDQACYSTPGSITTLTTYSSDASAYLGDVRRDWQQPLQMPVHSWMMGRETVIGDLSRPGHGRPTVLSRRGGGSPVRTAA